MFGKTRCLLRKLGNSSCVSLYTYYNENLQSNGTNAGVFHRIFPSNLYHFPSKKLIFKAGNVIIGRIFMILMEQSCIFLSCFLKTQLNH